MMAGTIGVGDRSSRIIVASSEAVAAFAALVGDDNPVHVDEAYAAASAFGRRIIHGALALGYVSSILGTELPGPGAVYLGQTVKFLAPLYPDERFEALVEVTAVRPDKPIVTLATRCTRLDGVVAVEGEAVLRVPAGRWSASV